LTEGPWLGIETTGVIGGIALVRGEETLAEEFLPVMATHSEKLLPGIERLIRSTGIQGGEIAGIAVSAGPGSYTGLRIGMATALGLARGWGSGVAAVETLRILACTVPVGSPVMPCIRARKGEVFAAVYAGGTPDSAVLVAPGVYTIEALGRLTSRIGGITAAGGAAVVPDLPGVVGILEGTEVPGPATAAILGSMKFFLHGFDRYPVPVYLRGFNQRAVSHVP